MFEFEMLEEMNEDLFAFIYGGELDELTISYMDELEASDYENEIYVNELAVKYGWE